MKRLLKNQPPGTRAAGGANTATKPCLLLNNITPVKFLGEVKIQPEVLLHAARGKNGGAARLFFLAKHFNSSGSRTIETKKFRRWLLSLGISQRVYELWLARALQIGLITRRDQWLDLTDWARGYAILGCFKIYKRPALIPLNKLSSKGWLCWTWAAYVKRYEGRIISQAALRKLTGIPERTQRQYERRAGVVITRNIAFDLDRKADQLAGTLEFGHKNAFAYKGVMAWGLPNSRQINGVNYGNKGRNRKIQKAINRSCIKEARVNQVLKIYHGSVKTLKAAQRKARDWSKADITLPDWLYLQSDNTRFWSAERV